VFAFLLAAALLNPVDEKAYDAILQQHSGKVVLVNFWATWCEPCREEMPLLAALENKFRERGFVLITISADEPEQERDAYEFLKQSGVRFPAYLKNVGNSDRFITHIDKDWSGALPALFLFDRSGRKVRGFIGETDPRDLEDAIRELL
jgi:thiol-disulfide isomerase/thioredoxin